MSAFSSVEIVGGGLIGTSIALKLAQNGAKVRIIDTDQAHQRVANSLLGNSLLSPEMAVSAVIAATPVDTLPLVITDSLFMHENATVIDIGSIKSKVVNEVYALTENKPNQALLLSRYLPTHPMAGREISGPDGARSDLFEGRVWALTPHAGCDPNRIALTAAFIEEMGSVVHLVGPEEHDRQVAMTSHLPQLLATLLGSELKAPLDLAGQGLRDMTRLAHSEAQMWASILEGNRAELMPLLDGIIKSINRLKDKNFNQESIMSLMKLGAEGAAKVPGKHGGVPRNYGAVGVVISDRAGQLGTLFTHCAEGNINIEDLRIEHSPGQETGLVTLYIKPGDLSTLNNHLSTLGWNCTILSNGT
jgi:prephenate dehydrogenase